MSRWEWPSVADMDLMGQHLRSLQARVVSAVGDVLRLVAEALLRAAEVEGQHQPRS